MAQKKFGLFASPPSHPKGASALTARAADEILGNIERELTQLVDTRIPVNPLTNDLSGPRLRS